MGKTIIKSYWSDMPEPNDNTDGFYIVNYPDGQDYKRVIDNAFSIIEGMRDIDLDDIDEDEIEFVDKAKNEIKGSQLKLEDLINWYEENRGCSLGSVLDFIRQTKEGWSYEILQIDDSYDMDYGDWD